jgi:hypothetical protein
MEDQPLKSEKCSSDDQPSDAEKIILGYAEQMNGFTHEKQPTPVIVRPLGSPNSSAGGPSDSYSESPDKCWSKKLDKQFQSALKQKLSRSDSTWISAATLVQWLQGINRTRPCRLLSLINTKALLAGLEQKQGTVSRRIVAPSPVAARQKPMGCLRDNPTDRTTSESTEARLDLVDWCVANRACRTPSLAIDQDRSDWLEKRLRWNVIGILRDPSAANFLAEKLYS